MKNTLLGGCIGIGLALGGLGGLAQATDKDHRHKGHQGEARSQEQEKTTLSAGSKELHQHMKQASSEMREMRMTGDVDHDFVTAMKQHHQHGVAMAEVVLRDGKDPKAREFAQKIVANQQKEMAEFDKWLSEHSPQKPGLQKSSFQR
jgi:uncharacterized protein (DUF305 family)